MEITSLSDAILTNDVRIITNYIDEFGMPADIHSFKHVVELAIDQTLRGRDGHSIRALMARDFSFLIVDYWWSDQLPQCCLFSLSEFAKHAKSRKQEALTLLREVYEYEAQRDLHIPKKLIPLSHPDMQKFRTRVERQLGIVQPKFNRRAKQTKLVPI